MELLEDRIVDAFPLEREGGRLVLVDVGSMSGVGAEWARLRPHLRILGFEPDAREYAGLPRSPHERHLPLALADRPRELELFVSKDPGKTSVFEPNWPLLAEFPFLERWETVERVRVAADRVSTLDRVAEAEGLGPVDFLKLDTQGSELMILQGAERVLAEGVLALKVEVEFLELYRGQPLFADVDTFLRARGFELADLRRVYWKREGYRHFAGRGQLVFGDALYVRSHAAVLERMRRSADPFALALRYAVAAAVHGLHDLAATLLQRALREGVGDAGRTGRLLETITAYDEFYHWDWATEDRVLGNRPAGS